MFNYRIPILIATLFFIHINVFPQYNCLGDSGRYVLRSTLVGIGKANLYDTYLSPLEYCGPELRFLHESMRMTKLFSGNVSAQRVIQANFSAADNISKSATMYSGMFKWNYALHYQFRINENFKFLAGPKVGVNVGVIYNLRNSNNPAQARAFADIDASAMAIYKLKIRSYPLIFRYQIDVPFIGIMFSPEYGQSYYELFSLKHRGHNILFTSFHNVPSLSQIFTVDFPIGKSILRAGYLCDIQQSKVNNLRSHIYSHNFMIGFVRHFMFMRGKSKIRIPNVLNPF